MGSLWSLKLFAEYRCVTCVSRFVGRLMMLMALKGHFLGQIPHPMQSRSEMKANFDSGVTSMQSLPVRTTGQDFLHSCLHFWRSISLSRIFDSDSVRRALGLHYNSNRVVSSRFRCSGSRSIHLIAVDDCNATLMSVLQPFAKKHVAHRVSLSAIVGQSQTVS